MIQSYFPSMGGEVQLVLSPDNPHALNDLKALALEFENTFSRFRADSEISRMNAANVTEWQASPLLLTAAIAAKDAWQKSAGLVDCSLLKTIEQAGYDKTMGHKIVPEAELLQQALQTGQRTSVASSILSPWPQVEVDFLKLSLTKPAEASFDFGGLAKGLFCDIAITLPSIAQAEFACVSASGDMRFICKTWPVDVEHPFGDIACRLIIEEGALATSGISRRLWQKDGRYMHHLLNPATGEPAWSGIIQVTALAQTSLDAEVLAKTVFLEGLEKGTKLLEEHGGVIITDDAKVHTVSGQLIREIQC